MRTKVTKSGYVGSTFVAEELGVSRTFARSLMAAWPETEMMTGGRLRLPVADAKRRISNIFPLVMEVRDDA